MYSKLAVCSICIKGRPSPRSTEWGQGKLAEVTLTQLSSASALSFSCSSSKSVFTIIDFLKNCWNTSFSQVDCSHEDCFNTEEELDDWTLQCLIGLGCVAFFCIVSSTIFMIVSCIIGYDKNTHKYVIFPISSSLSLELFRQQNVEKSNTCDIKDIKKYNGHKKKSNFVRVYN